MGRNDLANYASKSENSKGRRYKEEFNDDRTEYERDRDRIIHSVSFRRLEYKTQIFVNHEGDYYRTRLTHSLETAQISRSIARRLNLNEELVECLALAHDLGHTPFGHTGEYVLNELMSNFGGFDHNVQSLRVVEELEDRYPKFCGLNLTWETREGIIKHSSYYENVNNINCIQEYLPNVVPTLEAQIINPADEIAYINHDIDDGIEAGLITIADLFQIPLWKNIYGNVKSSYPYVREKKLKYKSISTLIGFLIIDIINNTLKNINLYAIDSIEKLRKINKIIVEFSDEIKEKKEKLKHFLVDNLYFHPKVMEMNKKSELIIITLFEGYNKRFYLLPERYKKRIESEHKERIICDYIAGMTDRFAIEEYNKFKEHLI
jgi:dGTPase